MNPNANPYTPGARIVNQSNKENISPAGYSVSPARDLSGRKPLHEMGATTPSFFAKPPPLQTRSLEDAATPARTPSRQVCLGSEQRSKGHSSKKSRSPTSPNDLEEDIRRVDQRNKQIGYGFNTDGYRNMLRLVESDPCLTKGGVIPLAPPSADVKVSKRTWDMLIRKWRRMLHMFDNVYIQGDSADGATMESVQHAQRLRWISPVHLQFNVETGVAAVPSMKSPSLDAVMALKMSHSVPTRMPIEESMQHLLRHPSCYEPVNSVIPDSLLYHSKGSQFSPTDIGIKVVVAPSSVPSQYATARSPSPEAPDFAPTATLARENASPRRCASPTRSSPDQSLTTLSPTRKLDATAAPVFTTQLSGTTDVTPAKAPAQYSSRRYRAISSLTPSRSVEVAATESPAQFSAFPTPQHATSPSPSPSKKSSLSASAPHFTPNFIKATNPAKTASASVSPDSSHYGGPSASPQTSRSNTCSMEPTATTTRDEDDSTEVAVQY